MLGCVCRESCKHFSDAHGLRACGSCLAGVMRLRRHHLCVWNEAASELRYPRKQVIGACGTHAARKFHLKGGAAAQNWDGMGGAIDIAGTGMSRDVLSRLWTT